jgi:phosphoenolpyruvate carboxykinase (ATP)
MGDSLHPLPEIATVHENPGPDWLRDQALRHTPRITETEFGNLNYQAEVTSRLAGSTFFVADHDFQNTISRPEYEDWARRQDEHLRTSEVIVMEGYIGPDPSTRVGCRLVIEASQANIPGMQRQLYFPRDDSWSADLTVIYTPSLRAPGKPNERLITVDLEHGLTRVLGSDYFGESKMGGLRMWNKMVFDQGGLGLHAGLKVFPAENTPDGAEQAMLIIGLSGTGKTTTTFSRQLGSLPVQDDFVALMPGGEIRTTENGCFAKTYGLNADEEPTIHGGTVRPDAWLENVHVGADGKVDFYDTSHTANGRSTFPLANIRHRSPSGIPRLRHLLMLNRSDHLIPAVAKLKPSQVPAYFMLGETKGTSAGGAAEEGKSLRVPGTNPFFFSDDSLQGNRLMDLFESLDDEVGVYVLNTGRVGGADGDERSKKVRIQDSSAIVEGIVDQSIVWETDPDFGYQVATSVAGVDDPELLQPRRLYERQGRGLDYAEKVETLMTERSEYLEAWPTLRREIIEAL